MSSETAPFLSVPEVGRRLGVSAPRAYALAARGIFPTLRLAGRRIVVPRGAFEIWVKEQDTKALANVRERDPVSG